MFYFWGWLIFLTIAAAALIFLKKLLYRQRKVSLEWRAYNEPLPKLGKGLKPWKCETCYGQGVYNITMPTRQLSFTEQMSMANQDTCPCCMGQCVHWRRPDSPPKCMKLAPKGEHG